MASVVPAVHAEAVDVIVELAVGGERAPGRAANRGDHLGPHLGGGERDGQRSARAPEAHAHHRGGAPRRVSNAARASFTRPTGTTTTTLAKRWLENSMGRETPSISGGGR
jgi:hypothetical protein